MNDIKREKLKVFVLDETMADAVYEVLVNSFLNVKNSDRDVHVMAAERLAIDFLNNAWNELEKFRPSSSNGSPPLKQVGL